MKLALACFVQTPGYSEILPEISENLGKKKTENIYLKIIDNMRTVLSEMDNFLDVFWAVDGDGSQKAIWKDFSVIESGEGQSDEGKFIERLSKIYNKLLDDYEGVIIVFPGVTELSSDLALEAIHFIKESNFVIGPSYNNNCYLFGGSKIIEKEIIEKIKINDDNILDEISTQISKSDNIYYLDPLSKIQTMEDLQAINL